MAGRFNPADHPRGTAANAGQFAVKQRDEVGDLELGAPAGRFAGQCGPEVAELVRQARSADLDAETASRLAAPDSPFLVRVALVGRADGFGAAQAADDPDPVVRAFAAMFSTGLDSDARGQLTADSNVARAVELLGHRTR